jgi:hypothetical protein
MAMTEQQQVPGITRTDLQRHDLSAAELATYVVEKGKPFLAVGE